MSFNDCPTNQSTSAVVKRILVGLTASLAIACQAPTVPPSQPSASSPAISATPTVSESSTSSGAAQPDQPRYSNEEIGFSFAYPNNFVLDPQPNTATSPEDGLELTLDLWQREQYQAIQAGEYDGGTEFPPNVQVVVYRASDGDSDSLQAWVEGNNRFVLRGGFQTQAIAGQEALTFSSDGLYSHQNVVLPSQSKDEIIVISFAQIGAAELDEPNQRAFEQVISTFQFTN